MITRGKTRSDTAHAQDWWTGDNSVDDLTCMQRVRPRRPWKHTEIFNAINKFCQLLHYMYMLFVYFISFTCELNLKSNSGTNAVFISRYVHKIRFADNRQTAILNTTCMFCRYRSFVWSSLIINDNAAIPVYLQCRWHCRKTTSAVIKTSTQCILYIHRYIIST